MLRGLVIGSVFTSAFLLTTQWLPENPLYPEPQATVASATQAIAQSLPRPIQTLYRGEPLTSQRYTIVAGGDIMLDRGVLRSIETHGENSFTHPFKHIAPYTSSADVFIANLEGPLSDLGANQGGVYSFRFAPEAIEGLIYSGVDVLSLANNHAMDWGSDAICDTYTRLKSASIAPIGAGCTYAQANDPYITQLGDTTVAFLSYTNLYPETLEASDNYGGVSETNPDNWVRAIKNLRDQKSVEVVIVSLHWGQEYQSRSDATQQKLAKKLIGAGADVIVGHHPHVTQEIEKIGDGWVVYSLGNLVFDQRFSEETMRGYFAEITIEKGAVVDITQRDYTINELLQPEFSADA